jgi:4'-phosphopantetheinyl transferase
MRPQLDAATRAAAIDLLSAGELERYLGTPRLRQDTFLTGRFLIRTLAAELLTADRETSDRELADRELADRVSADRVPASRLPVNPAEVVVEAFCPDCGGPHGRPVIANSRLEVSLAHSATAVVVAMQWDTPVGIDIEPAAQRAETLQAIRALAGEGSTRRWTQVEAILKADGRGLRVDPAQVSIERVGDTLLGRVADRPTRYRLSDVTLDPALQVSVAVALDS